MLAERLAWAGSVMMSGVGIYVSLVPITNQLGKTLVIALAGSVLLAAVLMFPWRRQSDGSPVRLYNVKVGGRGSRVQSAGDNATQVMASHDVTVNAPQRVREEGPRP
jgi:hypothetical protein